MKKYVVIDIGGTMIKYGIVDQHGHLLRKDKIPTEAELGGPGILSKVMKIIDDYQDSYLLSGICLSSAGMVDSEKGEIFYSGPAIPNYAGTEYKRILEKRYGIPCEIENDVNCAGMAEVISGSAKGSKITLCLTVGTGIGGCFLIDTEVFHGYSNSACEIGYLSMEQASFQELASTTALVENVAKAHGDSPIEWDGYRIFHEAKAGNQKCIAAIDQLSDYLGQGIAAICYVINPQTVVLGGGIMGQEDFLKHRIERALSKYLLPTIAEKITLTFAYHENDAGMLGAFYHFMNRQKHEGV